MPTIINPKKKKVNSLNWWLASIDPRNKNKMIENKWKMVFRIGFHDLSQQQEKQMRVASTFFDKNAFPLEAM